MDNGKKCVYIPFIASAPWNRKGSKRSITAFNNIGKILISVASLFGEVYLDTPVIELHSLPESEGFYRKIGMKETGMQKKGMKEFRLEKDKGFDLLRFLMPQLRKAGQNE